MHLFRFLFHSFYLFKFYLFIFNLFNFNFILLYQPLRVAVYPSPAFRPCGPMGRCGGGPLLRRKFGWVSAQQPFSGGGWSDWTASVAANSFCGIWIIFLSRHSEWYAGDAIDGLWFWVSAAVITGGSRKPFASCAFSISLSRQLVISSAG